MIEELNNIFMEVKDAEPEYENVPDGEYLAIVVGAEYKMSKSEKPMVQFQFKITEGDYFITEDGKYLELETKTNTDSQQPPQDKIKYLYYENLEMLSVEGKNAPQVVNEVLIANSETISVDNETISIDDK